MGANSTQNSIGVPPKQTNAESHDDSKFRWVRSRFRRMTAIRRKIVRFALRATGIVKMIAIPRAIEEVDVAKVIAFYVPNNFRKPLKGVPEFQRGKVIEFCPQAKKSA